MKYLVDTDWLIDVLSGIAFAASTLQELSPEGISVSVITLGELYEGAMLDPDPPSTLARYREFLAPFPVQQLTDPTMERFAWIRAQLRRAGNLIPDLDLLIAATALEQNFVLITRNLGHYKRIPGLRLYPTGE